MWERVVDGLIYDLAGLDAASRFGQAVHFFVYDTVKILVLLLVIIFLVSWLRTWFNTEKVRVWLQGKGPLTGHVLAALFGIITPFCSCSAIPLFLGFLQARIPVGVTFSFLISAPMNNEIAIAMLFALFGWKVTALYIGFGLLVAIFGGLLVGRLGAGRWVLVDVQPVEGLYLPKDNASLAKRLREAWRHTADLLKKISLYVALGVGVGAWIHGYVPTEVIAAYAGGENLLAVPAAVVLGVPLYSNAAGVMPLVEVLTAKGVLLGTALSFMMAVTALSLPEAMILKRILHWKLIGVFFGIVAAGIVSVGYLFNILLGSA